MAWIMEKEDKYCVRAQAGACSIANQESGDTSEQIDIEHVFDRFISGCGKEQTSTGLGLSIAKELVKRMNGEISAKTEKNEFIIEMRFPLSI